MKNITIIVAIAQNYAIGLKNQLLCHLPGDLKRFKEITLGHTVVMGKSTYDSLPFKPLPGRRYIVLSRKKDLQLEGCIIAHSVQDVVDLLDGVEESFIIGGAQIYREFLPLAQKLMLTIIHKDFEGDTFFPEIDFNQWYEIDRNDITDPGNLGFDFSYVTYQRLTSSLT